MSRSRCCINWQRITVIGDRGNMMSTAKCAAKVITVLTLAGMAFAAGETRKEMHFKVGKRPIVTINNPYGPVVVKAGAAHEVVVTAILHSDKVELDQSQSHNRIDIVSHLLQGADQNSGMVEYQITVPAEANLTLHSDTGRMHAEKLHGDLTIESNSGSMEVMDCGGGHVHVKTLTGPVSISNVANSHVEVISMGGNVSLSSVSNYVTVNSNTGKIEYAG